jgi:SPP1 family predicted phage head-tail adaptor
MQAGKLRTRLTIQNAMTLIDPYGESLKTWTTLATVWGSVEPLRMQEYFEAQQTQAKATHRIEIRYLPGVLPTQRIVMGSRIFEITAVLNPQERNARLQILAVEKPDYGTV